MKKKNKEQHGIKLQILSFAHIIFPLMRYRSKIFYTVSVNKSQPIISMTLKVVMIKVKRFK
jgi:hypothetical protein